MASLAIRVDLLISDPTTALKSLLAIPTLQGGIVKASDRPFIIDELETSAATLTVVPNSLQLPPVVYRIYWVAAFFLSVNKDVQGIAALDGYKFTNLVKPIQFLMSRQAREDLVLLDNGYQISAHAIAPITDSETGQEVTPSTPKRPYIFETTTVQLRLD